MEKCYCNSVRMLSILLLFTFVNTRLSAQLYHDNEYKFSVNIPSDWTSSSNMDGTDKVFNYYSADQNAAVQLRVFKTDGRVTTDLLTQVYESSMLPAGTKKSSLDDYTTGNGISGKQGVYQVNYNGNDVTLATFYTVQNNIGYVLTAIVPNTMIQQKGDEVKAVTKSFKIDGLGSSSSVKKTKGSSGSNSNVAGVYNFIGRSDGKDLLNYWIITIKHNGTYVDKHQLKNGYVSKNNGTWKVEGDKLTLTIPTNYGNGIQTVYTINGNRLIRKTDSGVLFTFKK